MNASTAPFSATDSVQNAAFTSRVTTKSVNSPMNADKLAKIYAGLAPLTAIHIDTEGRCIQLWKTRQYGLIGTVLDKHDDLYIISEKKIHNPLNDKQTPGELIGCLESFPVHHWDIAYDTQKLALTIWPHLEAAGKEDTRSLVEKKLSQLQSGQQNVVRTQVFPDGRVRYSMSR
jgi:hypothetical protein